MLKKIICVLLGNLIIGIGIGVTVYCNFGIDPSTTFFTGINNVVKIGLGNANALGNLFLFIPMLLLDKKTIHLGTFVNMFGIGYIVEFSSLFFISTLPEFGFTIKFIMLLFAILFITIGVGLYLSANMGQSPWDAMGHLVNLCYPKISYSFARIVQDITALSIGMLLRAPLGFGSIIFAFCLGPGINYFKKLFVKILFNTK